MVGVCALLERCGLVNDIRLLTLCMSAKKLFSETLLFSFRNLCSSRVQGHKAGKRIRYGRHHGDVVRLGRQAG